MHVFLSFQMQSDKENSGKLLLKLNGTKLVHTWTKSNMIYKNPAKAVKSIRKNVTDAQGIKKFSNKKHVSDKN